MLALSKKKKERNNNVSQVTRNNVFWWFLAAVILFLGFCCSSQGQISLSNRDNIFMRRTLHQVGSDVFLEPLEHVTRKQTNDSEVLIIPLAYRVPLGPEDIWKNILASESRKTHLLGKNRKSLARQLEQAFQVGNNVWEDELHFPVKDNPIRVQRYFEQVILGNVVNMAEYYVSLQVNGESFYVQLDTGSSNLLISTANCSHCRANKRLDFKGLTTISCSSSECCHSFSSCCSQQDPSLCGVSVEYGSGFASGVLVKGTVTISNMSVYTAFGGILNSSTDFEPPSVSGILGMASSQLACNPTCVTPLFDAIVQQKSIANVFSVLLNPDNGVLVLGGVDGNFSNESISYTDMPSSDSGYYEVVSRVGCNVHVNDRIKTVDNVSAGGTDVYQNSFTAIVDTGTTLVYLPDSCYNDIVRYFQAHHSNPIWNSSGALFGSLSSNYISSLPNVDIQLSGSVKVSIPPNSYLLSVGGGNFMFGIQSSGGSSAILGDVLLQNYYTVFDRVNSRIGFGLAVDVKNVNLSNVPGAGNISFPSPTSPTLPTYGIVLIVVAGVLGVLLFSMAVFLLVRRRRKATTIPSANVWSSQPYGVYGGSYYYYR